MAECAERSAAPPKVWQCVLNSKSKSLPKSIKPNLPSFKSLGQMSDYPLSILSPGLRTFRRAGPKFPPDTVFLAFRNGPRNLLRKIIKQSVKVDDFGLPKPSQNPSKTPPKSMSQQTCNFSPILASKSLCRKSAGIDFVLVFPILVACRTLFF